MPVLVGGLAANRSIYSVGMGSSVEGIQAKWDNAISNPIDPQFVDNAPCHEIIEDGASLSQPGLSLIHISEPTRQAEISYAGFCLKKKKIVLW